jgi:hypothetical protein
MRIRNLAHHQQENLYMKNINIIIAALTLLSSFGSAYADESIGDNSAEQTAVNTVETDKTEKLTRLNKACDTSATATINWKTYSAFSEADLGGRTLDNVYTIADNQALDVLDYITAGCETDGTFKKNVSKKLKVVAFTPVKGEVSTKNPSHAYKLSNGTLSVNYNFQTSDSSINNVRKMF